MTGTIRTKIAIKIQVLVALFVFANFTFAQVLTLEPALHDHIQEALQNNPDLESWAARIEAAEEKISQAGAWSDPTISAGLMNLPVNSFDFNQEAMTGAWLTLSQSIPLNRRLNIQSNIASLKVNGIQSVYQNRKLNISKQIASTWYDWVYLNESVSIIDTTIRLFDQILDISKTRYETGKGLQQDYLRVMTERSRMSDRRAGLIQMRLTTGRRFSTYLGRDPDNVPDTPQAIPMDFKSLDGIDLTNNLLSNNPGLRASKTDVAVAEEQVELKKRLWYPNLKLSAGYGYRQDADNGMNRPDFFTLTAGLSIPIYASSKQSAAVEEARAVIRQSEALDRNLKLQLNYELQALIDQDNRLAEQLRIYRNEIIPRANQTLAASTSTYSVGKTDIEALLMAETALFSSRLELLARIRDRLKVRAGIAALVGSAELVQLQN